MIHPLTIAYTECHTPYQILSKMANRHGLIAGATGTGKTITLRKIVEVFSQQGVPSFLVDVKGDLSGLALAGNQQDKVGERIRQLGFDDSYFQSFPVRFWDVYGQTGIPIRVSIEEMGVLLLSRLMDLTDTQEGVLTIIFRVAQDNQWRLIDLYDLRSMLTYVLENNIQYRMYGNIEKRSIGAIQRKILQLETEGANVLFGLPQLDLHDWLKTSKEKGVINILNAEKLIYSPRLYSAFMLWFLTKLSEIMPEVGDIEYPKLVMFFDEAHLMFDNSSPALLQKVEQVVRLIRSKGVGVYFISQNPMDIPEKILGQLGNRVQHALRAFTPRDHKAVKTVAETFRSNANLDVAKAISELAVGEALVSFLDQDGTPTIVQRTWVMPPQSQLNPLSSNERWHMAQKDAFYIRYAECEKIFSAYDEIEKLAEQKQDDEIGIFNSDAYSDRNATLETPLISVISCQSIVKGQSVVLPEITDLKIGLHWQSQLNLEIDVNVFMLGKDKKVQSDEDFIFYNQPVSKCSSVVYGLDKLSDNSASVEIYLAKLPENIHSLVFTASIYPNNSMMENENFSQIKQAFISVFDNRIEPAYEIIHFDLPDDYEQETAMIFGEIYRHHNQWKFRAIGQGYAGGLASLCQQYGVEVN